MKRFYKIFIRITFIFSISISNVFSEEIIKIADELITIPMQGFAQSLNVSVAAAVIFSEIRRQREIKGMYKKNWSKRSCFS